MGQLSKKQKRKMNRELREQEMLERTYERTDRQIWLTMLGGSNAFKFYQSNEWKQLRYRALKEYGPICELCGSSPRTGGVIQVDHIKPRSLYPELALDFDNLQILCKVCNEGKSNKDATNWRTGETHILRKRRST